MALKIHSVDDTADKVNMTTTKMHEIIKISIAYTMMVSSELKLPLFDAIRRPS